jgi:hypothetical protein
MTFIPVTLFKELVFKEARKTSYSFFSRIRQAKNLKAICACTESTDLIL